MIGEIEMIDLIILSLASGLLILIEKWRKGRRQFEYRIHSNVTLEAGHFSTVSGDLGEEVRAKEIDSTVFWKNEEFYLWIDSKEVLSCHLLSVFFALYFCKKNPLCFALSLLHFLPTFRCYKT